MGFPKFFSHLGCLEVTLVLRDYKTVTGKIVGEVDEDRKKFDAHYDGPKDEDSKKDCDWEHEKKHDDPCCKPPKVEVKVDVDDKSDFILLELTRDAESVSLQEVEINGELEIEWVNVEFKKGSCIAVNVADIIYAGVNAEIDEEEVEIRLGPPASTATTTEQTPSA